MGVIWGLWGLDRDSGEHRDYTRLYWASIGFYGDYFCVVEKVIEATMVIGIRCCFFRRRDQ